MFISNKRECSTLSLRWNEFKCAGTHLAIILCSADVFSISLFLSISSSLSTVHLISVSVWWLILWLFLWWNLNPSANFNAIRLAIFTANLDGIYSLDYRLSQAAATDAIITERDWVGSVVITHLPCPLHSYTFPAYPKEQLLKVVSTIPRDQHFKNYDHQHYTGHNLSHFGSCW